MKCTGCYEITSTEAKPAESLPCLEEIECDEKVLHAEALHDSQLIRLSRKVNDSRVSIRKATESVRKRKRVQKERADSMTFSLVLTNLTILYASWRAQKALLVSPSLQDRVANPW